MPRMHEERVENRDEEGREGKQDEEQVHEEDDGSRVELSGSPPKRKRAQQHQ